MKRFWTMALALAATACAPMQWVKPDADPAATQSDAQQCQMQAWQEARWRGIVYQGIHRPMYYRDALGRPYAVSPYQPFYNPFGDPYMEEMRLTSFCMRAKGYQLEP